jgi:hypothetical protein
MWREQCGHGGSGVRVASAASISTVTPRSCLWPHAHREELQTSPRQAPVAELVVKANSGIIVVSQC